MNYEIREVPKPKERFHLKPKHKKLLAALTLFTLFILAYETYGSPSITGAAVLSAPEKEATVIQEIASMEVTPESIVINTTRNQIITQELLLKNTGTIPLEPKLEVKGAVSSYTTFSQVPKLLPNQTKTLTLTFSNLTWSVSGALSISTAHTRIGVPITINVERKVNEITLSTAGGGSSTSFRDYDPPCDPLQIEAPTEIILNSNTTFNITLSNSCAKTTTNLTLRENFSTVTLSYVPPHELPSKSTTTIPISATPKSKNCSVESKEILINSSQKHASTHIKIHANGIKTSGAAYHERKLYNSNSRELVPVPYAKVETSPSCEKTKTHFDGTFEIFRPHNSDLFIIGSGFLVDEYAHAELTSKSPDALQFKLTKGRAKIYLHNHTNFNLGQPAQVTITAFVGRQDSVYAPYKGLHNTVLEAEIFKEVQEKEYLLGRSYTTTNLSQGTHYITLNLTLKDDVPGRDLNLPKLRVRLLTGTDDIITEKEEYTTVGFLKATLDNEKVIIENPTARTLKGITLSSSLENERGELTFLDFEENNFELLPKSSKEISFTKRLTSPGEYTGTISVSATLPRVGYWDEPASDLVSLPITLSIPGHDVAVFLNNPPTIPPTTPIKIRLENHGDFPEEVNLKVTTNNRTLHYSNHTIEPDENHLVEILNNLTQGLHTLNITAEIPNDIVPSDNSRQEYLLITNNQTLQNFVLIILDGAGEKYISQTLSPNLLRFKHRGFYAENMRVRIPSTTQSHSIMYTSRYEPDYDWSALANSVSFENQTIFDSARNADHLVLGVLGKGDTYDATLKFDAILYDKDNDLEEFSSDLLYREGIPAPLLEIFKSHNNLSEYQHKPAPNKYINYNQWVADSLRATIRAATNQSKPFIFISNMPGTDFSAHELAEPGYYDTYQAADEEVAEIFNTLFEENLFQNTLFIVTADHGMCFKDTSHGRVGHHSYCKEDEAFVIPFIVTGPTIQPKTSRALHYNDDIFLTLGELLNFPKPTHVTGTVFKDLFAETEDLGIISLETSTLKVGENTTTKIKVENVGTLPIPTDLCFEVSTFNKSIISQCSNPQNFTWKPPSGGIYFLTAKLQDDDNPHNNLRSETLEAGIFHDVRISEVEPIKEGGKLKAKVKIENAGQYNATNLSILCTKTNLGTGTSTTHTYTNKDIKPDSRKSFGPWSCGDSSATTALYNITFKLLNLTDANPSNNIKTSVTYFWTYD